MWTVNGGACGWVGLMGDHECLPPGASFLPCCETEVVDRVAGRVRLFFCCAGELANQPLTMWTFVENISGNFDTSIAPELFRGYLGATSGPICLLTVFHWLEHHQRPTIGRDNDADDQKTQQIPKQTKCQNMKNVQ